jgi:hypothetical protein
MAQSCTPQPQIDQQSAKELNLAVLQRTDADVEEILTTAGHVTLYEFDVDEKQWVSLDYTSDGKIVCAGAAYGVSSLVFSLGFPGCCLGVGIPGCC